MTNPIDYWYQKYLQEKKRADNLQSAIEVAEDHAYSEGSEAMKNKAVKWLEDELFAEKVNTLYPPMSIVVSKSYESVDEFCKSMYGTNLKTE